MTELPSPRRERKWSREKTDLFKLLRKSGLEICFGSGTMAPKTEAMHYPVSMGPHEDGDTTPVTVSGPGSEGGSQMGFSCWGNSQFRAPPRLGLGEFL